MRRLKILIWQIHGSYFNALARLDHDWYLPVKPHRPEGYDGRNPAFDLPQNIREVMADRVRDLDLDLVIYQTPKNFTEDREALLSAKQRSLPAIYLEHNTPRAHPTDTKHPVDDPNTLLVHVTHYNQLMWDSGRTPTTVIEHSVAIDPQIEYHGNRTRGVTVVNSMPCRGRIVGRDLFLRARESVPLDLFGMQNAGLDCLGEIPYRELHRRIATYRFLFSPMRYTSLPLAVIEAMMIGMPVVALATTELPTVIDDGETGYISCDIDVLIQRMQSLLGDPDEARRLGANARTLAHQRFGLDRFVQDWNTAFSSILGSRR